VPGDGMHIVYPLLLGMNRSLALLEKPEAPPGDR
jgi:hypothetical protein